MYLGLVNMMSMFQNDIIIHLKMVAIKLPYHMLKKTPSWLYYLYQLVNRKVVNNGVKGIITSFNEIGL